MNLVEHFEAAIKQQREMAKHIEIVAVKLRELLEDEDASLLFQSGGDGWVVSFDGMRNSTIAPADLKLLLLMQKDDAFAYLMSKSI